MLQREKRKKRKEIKTLREIEFPIGDDNLQINKPIRVLSHHFTILLSRYAPSYNVNIYLTESKFLL